MGTKKKSRKPAGGVKRKSASAARRGRVAVKTKQARAAGKKKAARRTRKPAISQKARLERNKKTVLAFYELAINQKDFEAASKYMAPHYIQHNPTAADGREGLKAFVEVFKRDFPNLRAHFKRVIAEGDYVVLHVLGSDGPDPQGTAVVDIFRLENGKVAEHWDVIQPIPATVQNANSMF